MATGKFPHILLFLLVVLCLFNTRAGSDEFWEDTVISSSESYDLIEIYDTPPDTTTVECYGYAKQLIMHNSSTLNLNDGGQISEGPPLVDNSYLYDSSTLNVYEGGLFQGGSGHTLSLNGSSSLNVYNGTIHSFTGGYDSSIINLYDGYMYDTWVNDLAVLNVYGGEVDSTFYPLGVGENATVNIYGYGFEYNVIEGDDGYGGTRFFGRLTGFGPTGTPIYFFDIPDPATHSNINLIPEPATISLLGLGVMVLRRRRKA